jgi:hypothetical protein
MNRLKLIIENSYLMGYDKEGKLVAHKPLTDAPILEGVPLLPEWGENEETIELNYYKELEDRREVARNFKGQVAGRHRDLFGNSEIHHMMRGFLEGYNKAKETYKYTEEDLRKAIAFGGTKVAMKDSLNSSNVDDYIQSLQQPKRPKYFEMSYSLSTKVNIEGDYIKEPRTITNSQGQTELIGTYFYE